MDNPTIKAPLKTDGTTVGEIEIGPDGKFTGEITSPEVMERLTQFLMWGFADGVMIVPSALSARRSL